LPCSPLLCFLGDISGRTTCSRAQTYSSWLSIVRHHAHSPRNELRTQPEGLVGGISLQRGPSELNGNSIHLALLKHDGYRSKRGRIEVLCRAGQQGGGWGGIDKCTALSTSVMWGPVVLLTVQACERNVRASLECPFAAAQHIATSKGQCRALWVSQESQVTVCGNLLLGLYQIRSPVPCHGPWLRTPGECSAAVT
jgi:hypothetical protein